MGGDSSTDPIDSVEYDTNAGWDFVTDDGFSYELVAKGFDNDVGANWAQSCTVFGTPGSDPSATCTAGCSVNGCGAGNSCSNDAAMCVCDAAMSYYPRCTSSTSCTKCATLYPPDSCTATWRKNGTYRYAVYEWEANENVGDGEFFYQFTYFSGSRGGDGISTSWPANFNPLIVSPKLIETIYVTSDFWNQNITYGGYVETVKEVCTGDFANLCLRYYSQKTMCTVITPEPSKSPTRAPTEPTTTEPTEPTTEPTRNPTTEPTSYPISVNTSGATRNRGYEFALPALVIVLGAIGCLLV